MNNFPGLELAEQHEKAVPQPISGYLNKSLDSVGEQSSESQDASFNEGDPAEKRAYLPTMQDLIKANEALLEQMRKRNARLEAICDRILGTVPKAMLGKSLKGRGDTVAARLWSQNTELLDESDRLGLTIDRLQRFA